MTLLLTLENLTCNLDEKVAKLMPYRDQLAMTLGACASN